MGSRVSGDEALSEIRRLRENVESGLERSGHSGTAASTGSSRMFADWARTNINGKESPLEPASGTATTTGPESEILPHNGEIRFTKVDDSLPDRGGVGFAMVRTYRSQTDYAGPLGNGWDHNLNQRLVFDAPTVDTASRVDWLNGNRRISFKKSGKEWKPEAGAFYRLTVSTEAVVVETPLLQKITFEPAVSKSSDKGFWRIREMTSRHDDGRANVMRFRYASHADLLREVVEPRGLKIDFAYDRQGLLVEMRRGSFVVRYDYDSNGNLTGTTIPNVARTLDRAIDLSWKYGYETKAGHVALVSVTPPGGPRRNYRYANDSRRVVEVDETGIDGAASLSARWNIESKQEAGNILVSVVPPSPSPKRVYTFSLAVADGRRPVLMSMPSRNATYHYRYNTDDLLTEETTPLQTKRIWNFDSGNPDSRFRGNLLEERISARPGENPLGISAFGTTYAYSPQISLPITESSFEIDLDGKRRVLREIHTEYSADFEPCKVSNGRQTTWTIHNRFGLPVIEGNAIGVVNFHRYGSENRSGNPEMKHGGFLAEVVQDVRPEQVSTALRSLGITVPAPFPSRKATEDPVQRKTRFDYDRHGRVVRETCDDGYRIESVYNKLGLPLTRYDSRGDLDVTEYDSGMRKDSLLTRVSPLKEAPFQGESVRGLRGRFYRERFERDSLGRLAVWTPTPEPLTENGPPSIRYTRYPSGEIRTRRTADGGVSEQIFDTETGYLKEKRILSSKAEDPPLIQQSDFRYDPDGFLVSCRDDLGAGHSFKSDPFGRSFSETGPDGIEHRTFTDGLGRTIRTQSISLGKTIAESESVYDPEGNLVTQRVRRLGETVDDVGRPMRIDVWLVAGEYQYDEAGNQTASRSFRKDAWTRNQFDGLGRVISVTTPEGDEQVSVFENGLSIVQIDKRKDERSGKTVTTRTCTFFDERRNPYLSVPVGTDGKASFSRSPVRVFDTRGEVVQSATPGLMKDTVVRNSMGWAVRETSVPLSTRFGEKPKSTETKFNAVGNVVFRKTHNAPLALFSPSRTPTEDFIPRLNAQTLDVPQIIQHEYDGYGRLSRTTQPDGLIKTNEYGAGSMLARITTTHADHPGEKHVVVLRYDERKTRRLTEIVDGQSQRQVQLFQYDDFGNVTVAEDQSSPGGTVTARRRYDNLSHLLTEDVEAKKNGKTEKPFGTFAFDVDPESGKQTFAMHGKKHVAELWTKTIRRTDKDGRLKTIGVDTVDDYCLYSYLGSLPVGKKIAPAGISLDVDTNSLLDPIRYEYRDMIRNRKLCELDYQLDSHGRVTASSCRLDYGRWERTQYFQHDATSALIGENRENFIPERLETRRKELLESNDSLASWQSRWYDYDQVGNMTATYRKLPKSTKDKVPAALQISGENFVRGGAAYYSSAPLFATAVQADRANWPERLDPYRKGAMADRELASNRLLTMANDDGHTEKFKYDWLGRLAEYDTKIERRTLRFKIEYDLLGRVVGMTGDQIDSEDKDKIVEKEIVKLDFLNDSFNRRIFKEVRGKDENAFKIEATGYVDREPIIVVEKKGESDSWSLAAQYLWGASTREILTAVLPKHNVDPTYGGKDHGVYSLVQDRMLNVILCTSRQDDKMEIHDVASYWGFGENNTTGQIASVESSHRDDASPKYSFDKRFDDESDRFSAKGGTGRILISLERLDRLNSLTIRAESGMPTDIKAYVVDEGVSDPINNGVCDENLISHIVETAENEKNRLLSTPIVISLDDRFGKHIVLEWSGGEKDFSIHEFEVAVQPSLAGNLGFGGAWLDKETGLYYQGSRYRLPSMGGKFISPDPLGYLDGDNLYAYAHNDPLTWHDPDGEWAHILIGGVVGGILGGGAYAMQCWWTGEEFSWAKFGLYTVAGAASGAVAAATFGVSGSAMLSGMAGGFAYGFVSGTGMELLNGGTLGSAMTAGFKQGAVGAAIGAAAGGMGGALAGRFGNGFIGTYAAGVITGGTIGAGVEGGVEYWNTGSWASAGQAAIRGGVRGAAIGGSIATAGYGVGRFLPSHANGTTRSTKTYTRPGSYRSGVRDQVWNEAVNPKSNRVHDPLTGKFMSKNQPWDMGHKQGYEFSKHQASAHHRGISRSQFLDEHNNPSHYRPELLSSNRSHRAEAPSNYNLWSQGL